MNYPESVQFLYSLGNEIKTFKPGLESMRVLLQALDNPERRFRTVHVAGTNGKGSTSAMIASGLIAAGIRTGLYTSPHLVEPAERVQIDGRAVTPETFARAFDQVHEYAERLMQAGELPAHPTYFETVTAMAFLLFRDSGVQTAVVEVGLGGRLDSTNLVKPAVCVITPIDFDHEAYLGNTIEAIAAEKAGILKPGAKAVIAAQRDEADAVVTRRAKTLGMDIIRSADYVVSELRMDAHGSRFRLNHITSVFDVSCPLAGEHQVENAITAIAALSALGIPRAACEQGISQTKWPGRLERVKQSPDIILDGAHNPSGVRALAAYIQRFFQGRKIWMIYGSMRDKAIGEIGDTIFPLADELIFTAPKSSRAVQPEALLAIANHPRARATANLEEALTLTAEASPDDVIFITGSLYLVGEARPLFVE